MTKPLWPVMEYVAQYDYIVATLCENRDKPEMNCNGKCYLTKQLAKDATDEENNPLSKNSQTEIPQYIVSEKILEFVFTINPEFVGNSNIGERPNLYLSIHPFQLLHPPELS